MAEKTGGSMQKGSSMGYGKRARRWLLWAFLLAVLGSLATPDLRVYAGHIDKKKFNEMEDGKMAAQALLEQARREGLDIDATRRAYGITEKQLPKTVASWCLQRAEAAHCVFKGVVFSTAGRAVTRLVRRLHELLESSHDSCEGVAHPLLLGPSGNLVDVHVARLRDEYSLFETLQVLPVIVRGETVLYTVCRRQQSQ
jgi:hypothetical protein